MEVNAISNSQTVFKGRLGRNIQAYINQTVEQEINSIVKLANNRVEHVNTDKIKEIKNLGDSVLARFTDYVAPMHEKTVFDMSDNLNSSHIRTHFKNSLVPNREVKIFYTSIFNETGFCNKDIYTPTFIDVDKLSNATIKDLKILDNLADQLYKIPRKTIDKIFYTSAQYQLRGKALRSNDILSKFIIRLWANALDKFAESMGFEGTNRRRAEIFFRKAKENSISRKKMEKSAQAISKENQKIADKILKG